LSTFFNIPLLSFHKQSRAHRVPPWSFEPLALPATSLHHRPEIRKGQQKNDREQSRKDKKRNQELERELRRKDRALAETAARLGEGFQALVLQRAPA
jgi:hypothetical protein